MNARRFGFAGRICTEACATFALIVFSAVDAKYTLYSHAVRSHLNDLGDHTGCSSENDSHELAGHVA